MRKARRGNREGSIYRRKSDGRWCASITTGWRAGKRTSKTFYGETREEVAEKLVKGLRDRHQGLPLAAERDSLAQFLLHWLEHTAKPTVRPKTFVDYEINARLHINPVIGHVRLARLTAQHIQTLIQENLSTGLHPKTVRNVHATLRAALNNAVRFNLIVRNPAELVDAPRVPHSETKFFTPEQSREFLRACAGHRLEALFTACLSLGLRIGEALGLMWDAVALEKRRLVVLQALQRVKGNGLQLVEPKSARSRRTVALPEQAIRALKAHRRRQQRERIIAGSRWREIGLVFTTTIGTPLDARAVHRQYREILSKTNLPKLRLHDLRHTAATLLLAQGVHPRVVMDLLGHSQISLTLNTYSHVIPALRSEAADKMTAILKPKSISTTVKTTVKSGVGSHHGELTN